MFALPDSEILPLFMQHTFWTWSAQAKVCPIPVTRAKGVYFWDVDGRRYLTFNSMTMCINIGHGDERVIHAIIEQARELPYVAPGMASKPRAVLVKLLSEIDPGEVSLYGALDMAGNVWEWVADWYSGAYYSASPSSNPLGPDTGEYRVLRGGAWNRYENDVRSAYRKRLNPDDTHYNIGFRCSRSP